VKSENWLRYEQEQHSTPGHVTSCGNKPAEFATDCIVYMAANEQLDVTSCQLNSLALTCNWLFCTWPDRLTDNHGNTCKVTTTAFQVVMEILVPLMVAGDSIAGHPCRCLFSG